MGVTYSIHDMGLVQVALISVRPLFLLVFYTADH
jgi:hypothetical protein